MTIAVDFHLMSSVILGAYWIVRLFLFFKFYLVAQDQFSQFYYEQ